MLFCQCHLGNSEDHAVNMMILKQLCSKKNRRKRLFFCKSVFFNDGENHVFYCIAHFWMTNHKMNDRHFVFRYHYPASFVNKYLNIPKCRNVVTFYRIICMGLFISLHTTQMFRIFFVAIKYVRFIEHAGERQRHRIAFKLTLRQLTVSPFTVTVSRHKISSIIVRCSEICCIILFCSSLGIVLRRKIRSISSLFRSV